MYCHDNVDVLDSLVVPVSPPMEVFHVKDAEWGFQIVKWRVLATGTRILDKRGNTIPLGSHQNPLVFLIIDSDNWFGWVKVRPLLDIFLEYGDATFERLGRRFEKFDIDMDDAEEKGLCQKGNDGCWTTTESGKQFFRQKRKEARSASQ